MTSPNKPEPPPVQTDGKPIWELVLQDMKERNEEGVRKYGTPLQAHNGRRPLVDAYQEALDLAVYLRQAIEEDTLTQRRTLKRPPPELAEALVSWLPPDPSSEMAKLDYVTMQIRLDGYLNSYFDHGAARAFERLHEVLNGLGVPALDTLEDRLSLLVNRPRPDKESTDA